ncbi:IclR family transcriptional regulator [Streptomyces sp. SID10853]|uniref:IclR family transcriptional regulator n=1 Tax=Streptomyces sp. SID10853 TaxID=2706028 RepID=UPI0013C036DC|nr:IclR family transcriptional regulator [Streptomyces sp. SID10853]NDZ78685.1 IclR family transcriptional regulator [Streptomyces sp. SID10853]
MTSAPARHAAPQTSLGKGLAVLAALADHGPLRVDALAERTGLPSSTVYRYVRELVAFGFIESRDGVFVAGERLAQLARTSGWNDRLTRYSSPLLAELSTTSGESAILTVLVGRSALVVDRAESPQAIRLSFEQGSLLPLHAGASAKIVLAHAPAAVVDDVIEHAWPDGPGKDAADRRLRTQLAGIRQAGHATTHSEADQHAVGIAVPVMCRGTFACGLSLAGPAYRIDAARARELLELLHDAGRRLSQTLTATADL